MIKSTGVVRQVDSLGRIVLPVELRRTLGFSQNESIEIFTDGDAIVLKKYDPGCVFCGTSLDAIDYKGKPICKQCFSEIASYFLSGSDDQNPF